MSTFIVWECWVHPDCHSIGEALNNPRLNRIARRCGSRDEAEQYKARREADNKPNFIYIIDEQHTEEASHAS